MGATGGFVFGIQAEGVKQLSSHRDDVTSDLLRNLAEKYLEAELDESRVAIMTGADQEAAGGKKASFILADGRSYEPVLLYHYEGNQSIVIGIATIVTANRTLREVNFKTISALSRALLSSGAVVPRVAAI